MHRRPCIASLVKGKGPNVRMWQENHKVLLIGNYDNIVCDVSHNQRFSFFATSSCPQSVHPDLPMICNTSWLSLTLTPD